MNAFYLSIGLLTLSAVFFVAVPLWRGARNSGKAAVDRQRINVNLYQERLTELEQQRQQRILSELEYQQMKTELQRSLVQSSQGSRTERVSTHYLVISLSLLIVPLSVPVIYWFLSWEPEKATWIHLEAQPYENIAMDDSNQHQILKLQRYAQTHPDDHEAWHLLGQQYLQSGIFQGAAIALDKAFKLKPDSLDYRVSLALALIRQNDAQLEATSEKLLLSVLQQVPDHQGALSLLGMAAFNAGQFQTSIDYWSQLRALRDPLSESAALIERSIQQAEQRLGASTQTAERQITVSVHLPLGAQLPESSHAALFVIVRGSAERSRPIAVKRLALETFPMQITVTDADLMFAQDKFSNHKNLWVTAKITAAGGATDATWMETDVIAMDPEQPKVRLELVRPSVMNLNE